MDRLKKDSNVGRFVLKIASGNEIFLKNSLLASFFERPVHAEPIFLNRGSTTSRISLYAP